FPPSLAKTRLRFFPVSARTCQDPALTRRVAPSASTRPVMRLAPGFVKRGQSQSVGIIVLINLRQYPLRDTRIALI
ncbi:hypothetical protein QMO17_29075, partial [Klebsiella pneumoniae]|nr:hypothetical protein [Klebsiella pneumoniae]